MKNHPIPICRFLAFFLALSLATPNSAFALRVQNGGLEEKTPTVRALERALGDNNPVATNAITTGLEERFPGLEPTELWNAIFFPYFDQRFTNSQTNQVDTVADTPGIWLPPWSPRPAAVRMSPNTSSELFAGEALRVARNLRAMAALSLATRGVPNMDDINSITFVELGGKTYAVITSA